MPEEILFAFGILIGLFVGWFMGFCIGSRR
jgi:hypothetical protein